MAFPIIPKKRSGSSGYPTTLQVGELAVNTLNGELYLGGDSAVMLLNGPVVAGSSVTELMGDGSTTEYSFIGYNGTDDGGYIVSVGGIDQPPSKYTISNAAGGTIIFVDPPVFGEIISIRALVAGGGGSGSGDATSLQGVAISATSPTTGQGLVYNGTEWAPEAPSSNATQLQGTSLAATSPTRGQGLVYNGSVWEPHAFEGNATSINGISCGSANPTPNQVLIYSGADAGWIGADVNAVKIQSNSISTIAPSTGQVLQYSGTEWAPASLSSDATSLQGTGVSTTAPATGQYLAFNAGQWAPTSAAIPEWSSSVWYYTGDRVIRYGVVYRSQNTNFATDPAIGTDTMNWAAEVAAAGAFNAPTNTTTPASWIRIVTGNNVFGFIPIYQ